MTEELLDHLVYATPDLEQTVRSLAERTGVTPVEGGRHEGLGTRNYLLGLGGRRYLEIIGRDESQSAPPQWFGLLELTRPRMVAWAVRPADLDATIARARDRGYDPGPAAEMSRLTTDGELLSWRLTVPRDDGLAPFLIDWGATPHPADRGLPVVRLAALHATHPDPDALHRDLDALAVRLDIIKGDGPALIAELEGGITLT